VTAGSSAVPTQASPRAEVGRSGTPRIRREASITIVVVVAVVITAAGIGAYLWSGFQSQPNPPTRYDGLFILNPTSVIVVGDTRGPGGCSSPGSGVTEYCYTAGLVYQPGSLLLGPRITAATMIYETTADASFWISDFSSGANVTFVNVTLLDDSGRILATYTPGAAWGPYGGDTLPITLSSNETIVLNVGETSASGDSLRFAQGSWGMSATQLP
jgi:hypothetical protein